MAKPPSDARDWGEATKAVHAGAAAGDKLARTVGPPVQRGSTVLARDAASLYAPNEVTYGRMGLSSHNALAAALAALEGGVDAQLYSSGLAALTGAMTAMLSAGDAVLAVDCVYAPIRRFCDGMLKRYGVSTTYAPARATADELMALLTPATRLIVLESPGSLTFEMQDVPAIAAAAKARGVPTLIDNTYGAGVLFKPLSHGIDISVQALTKYVGGHSDVFMGSAATADERIAARLKQTVRDTGWAVSPDDAYLMLRGMRTLSGRLERHGSSGLTVARWLAQQPEVARVLHPGLPDFPDHALFQRDFTGPNGLFSVELVPGGEAAVHGFLDALELFGLGFSWGGFESLAIPCDPQLRTSRTAERWSAAGPIVRFHIGLEDPVDLIGDLRRGLDVYGSQSGP